MNTIPDSRVGAFLQWAYDFSKKLPDEAQVEMQMRVLQFVAQGFNGKDLAFDIEAAAEGNIPDSAGYRVSLQTLIEAFRYYDDRRDSRGATTAQVVWHMVGVQRVANLN